MKRNYLKVLLFLVFIMAMFCLNANAMESKNKEECFFVKIENGYSLFNYDSKEYNSEIKEDSKTFNRNYIVYIPSFEKDALKNGLGEVGFINLKNKVSYILGEIDIIYKIFSLASKEYNDYYDNGPELFDDYQIERIEKDPRDLLRKDLLKFVDGMKDLFLGTEKYKFFSDEDRIIEINEKIRCINRAIFIFFDEVVRSKVLIKDYEQVESEEESD